MPGGIGVRSGEGDQPQIGKSKGRQRARAAPGKGEGARASQEEQERQERLDLRGCGQGRAPIFGSSPQEIFQEEFQGIRSHSTWGCASLLRQETEEEPSEGDGRCPFPSGQRWGPVPGRRGRGRGGHTWGRSARGQGPENGPGRGKGFPSQPQEPRGSPGAHPPRGSGMPRRARGTHRARAAPLPAASPPGLLHRPRSAGPAPALKLAAEASLPSPKMAAAASLRHTWSSGC